MKKILIVITGFILVIMVVLAAFTIQGRTVRQTELENAMDSSLEKTMQMLMAADELSPSTDEEMIAFFMQSLASQIESTSKLTVNVLEADAKKGFLSAEAILTYKHPIGTEGHISCHKTIMLEQYITVVEKDIYTIQFLLDPGDEEEEIDPVVYRTYQLSEGSSYTDPGIPVSVSGVFKEWTSDLGTGDFASLTDGKTVEKDITFTAVWNTRKYEAKFDANGGIAAVPAKIEADYDTELGELPVTTKTGYTFEGWFTLKEGGWKITDETHLLEDITYYAQWKPNKYTIEFDANTGSGTMLPSLHTYDSEKEISENRFFKKDAVFNGWNTKADGSGKTYTDKEMVKNLTEEESIILHAQWKTIDAAQAAVDDSVITP